MAAEATGMRLGDSKFFNLFSLIASTSNPDRDRDEWQAGEVAWKRERTSFKGPQYSLQMEVHTLNRAGKRGWTLIVARETWWASDRRKAFRDGHWVHVCRGARKDVEKWFSEREALL